jgi:hypothetical protein
MLVGSLAALILDNTVPGTFILFFPVPGAVDKNVVLLQLVPRRFS